MEKICSKIFGSFIAMLRFTGVLKNVWNVTFLIADGYSGVEGLKIQMKFECVPKAVHEGDQFLIAVLRVWCQEPKWN